MAAKFHLGFPGWMIVKLGILAFFGATIVLAKRGLLKSAALWCVVFLLGGAAAWLGIMKPF